MNINQIYNEPCLDTISKMPDDFLDCVITSPPYWQLRDYGYSGQWGLEPTFQEYLDHLWELMDAVKPKLKSTGTIWVNLGDTYGTQSGNFANPQYESKENNYLNGTQIIQPKSIHKSLLLLPHRFAIGCIDRGWLVRNDIIWAKRNAMPESVTDRFSKKHEYFFFMTKSTKYFFDLEAIKDKTITFDSRIRDRETTKLNNTPGRSRMGGLCENNYTLKNPGSVSDFWDVPTKPSKEDHYASYNDNLIRKPILAGCPKGGIVYDPFMGTGSTAKIALRTGRNFIGSEMSEDYFSACQKQLDGIMSQQLLF